jgi:hypothetical protein
MQRVFTILVLALILFSCQSKGVHRTDLDRYFSDPQQTTWCQYLPGILLEMGTDIQLNNNEYCFEKTGDEIVLQVSSAHHYLNEAHPIIIGDAFCRSGDISESTEWLSLEWRPSGEPLFLKKAQQCGPYGCAYQLSYVAQVEDAECLTSLISSRPETPISKVPHSED